MAAQVTTTVVTFVLPTNPPPFATSQFCVGLEGCVKIVTLYPDPAAIAVAKVKLPLLLMVRLSPRLSCNTSPDPVRPVTVPPIVNIPFPAPHVTGVAKVKPPFALTDKLSPPLSCNTTVPVSPETVPPIVKVLVVQVI